MKFIYFFLQITLISYADYSHAKEGIDSSVVRIETYRSDEYAGGGSGVVFSKSGHVLTNAHVLKNANQFVIFTGTDSSYKSHHANIVWTDNKLDLAIIQAPDIGLNPVVISTYEVAKGSQVYAVGFPGVADALSDNNDLLESTVTQGVVGRYFNGPIFGNKNLVRIVQHSTPINPGNSGGGLFDECGNLIGVNYAAGDSYLEKSGNEYTINQVNGMSFAVSISEAIPVIEEKGIEILLANGCDTGSMFESQNTSNEKFSQGENNGLKNSSLIFYIIGLVSLVFASIAIWVALKKWAIYKKGSASENHTCGFVLKGIDALDKEFLVKLGQNNKFSLGIPVVIGRSGSESDFAIEDQSVSRRHFEVMLKSNRILVRDLASTNGTKVNGSKISSQWVPVSVGSEIQAGNVSLALHRS